MTSSWQFNQVFRYLSVLLLSVILARNIQDRSALATIELLFLIGSLFSSALVSSVLQAGLLPAVPTQNLKATSMVFLGFGLLSSLLFFLGTFAIPTWNHWSMPLRCSVAAWLACMPLGFVLEHLLFRHQKSGWLRVSSFISGSTYLALGSTFLWWPLGSSGVQVFSGLAIFAFLKALIAIHFVWKIETDSSIWNTIKPLLHQTWPLLLAFVFGMYSMYLDGIWVATWAGASAFLLFSYGAREFPLSQLLANGFSENQVRHFRTHGQFSHFKKEQIRIGYLTIPASIALMVSAPFLFNLVFGSSFAAAAGVFQVYLLLIVPRLFFPQTLLYAYGYSKWALPASIVEWLINVGCSIWWLHLWGWEAVAWATVLAFCIEKLLLLGILRKKSPETWQQAIPPKPVLLLLLLLGFTFLLLRLDLNLV